ncbi:unnamed protein product [Owenia fusiformis]|uniref:Uncharacterized protein n=1 Tax=Owenia fusiformis TaxID=6347 RepID=A0A8J1T7D8_OWEFU|nr:unnamed protein product [Owenia fusiformis]
MTPAMSFYKLAAIFSLGASWVSSVEIVNTFQTYDPSVTFNHMAIDENTGKVYIGGINRLYQLQNDLSLEVDIVTGPELDNPQCQPHVTSCASSKFLTNNHNKVLVIDETNNQLITCGSIFQGTCQVRSLGNITDSTAYLSKDEYYIAANNATLSTVAYVVPGPDSRTYLNVASSFVKLTKDVVFRDEVPAVSTRILDISGRYMFNYAHLVEVRNLGSRIFMDKSVRDTFIVHYVTGFATDKHNYFLSVQKESTDINAKYVSKLIRLCQNDDYYRSYTEIPIECGDYNQVQDAHFVKPGSTLARNMNISSDDNILVGVFAKGNGPFSVTSSVAVCFYSLSEITSKYTFNIQRCYQGSGERGKKILPAVDGCLIEASTSVTDDFCGDGTNSPIGGTTAIRSEPTHIDANLTSVTVTTSATHTIAHLGTKDGHLKRVLLTNAGEAVEYADISVDSGYPVSQDMKTDPDVENIYVMTQHRVSKVALETCREHTTCDSCLATKDPHCGWCSLENKCSTKADCAASATDLRWLGYGTDMCLKIQSKSKDQTPVEIQTTIDFSISQLPANQEYSCVFGDENEGPVAMAATVTSSGLQCQTPPTAELPSVSNTTDHILLSLYIRSETTEIAFLKTHFTFFNCGVHTSCSSCVTRRWACDWCINDNKCRSNQKSYLCQVDVVKSKEDDMCPRLEPFKDPLLLHNGHRQSITLEGNYLPEPLDNQGGYECLVHIDPDVPVRVPATRRNEKELQCHANAYTYPENVGERAVEISVVWNGNHVIDRPPNYQGEIYKCDLLGPDCSICLSLQHNPTPKYKCSWCDGSCHYNATCVNPPLDQCPLPILNSVYPLSSPKEGGTEITILGTNLGSRFSDVENSVVIAGKPCIVLEEKYEISKKIVCRTGSAQVKSGTVKVSIGGNTVTWPKFHYKDPKILNVLPSKGPKSGGSKITITGNDFDTGNSVHVNIKGVACPIVRGTLEANRLVCLTGRVPVAATKKEYVWMTFDEQTPRTSERPAFMYTEDPVVTLISPLVSFASGGRMITVTGSSLSSVQYPEMFIVSNGRRSNTTVCSILADTKMKCPTPEAPQDIQSSLLKAPIARDRRQTTPNMVEVGFIMDGVLNVQNLTQNFPDVDATIEYVIDPKYDQFVDNKKVHKGSSLILEGNNLNIGCTKDDVHVKIGKSDCDVTSLALSQLVCTPPETQPLAIDEDGKEIPDKLPEVTVYVGNLIFKLGELEYEILLPYTFPLEAIIGICTGGGFLILVIIIICVVYMRHKNRAKRQYKKIQIQLDTLESNVRNECKLAFAELQTEMSDVTSDLSSQGIPYWDYKTYTMKILFPGQVEAPLQFKPDGRQSKVINFEHGMHQFSQLLCNKHFLKLFIRTLEAQKTFSIRDKANVASYLMIFMQDKMEYATEVLKELMEELIKKNLEKKQNPKLMLRRTESVVEKLLTNWLSLCMYNYLKDYAGTSFFMLYKSIKQQTEKGPIDALTSDARYSLSEDKLLKEKMEYKTTTVNLVLEPTTDVLPVKLLDCDTVSQAKEKLLDAAYRNTPLSHRPNIFDVELEYRHGHGGHLVLQDEDLTTKNMANWKKINTLGHYEIPENAVVALVMKQETGSPLKAVNGNVDISQFSYSSMSPTLQGMTDVSGAKFWHMIKQYDDNQNHKDRDTGTKVISEIFLTRLLSTKGTLQKFIDDMFDTILNANKILPLAVKYLFDYLDDAAERHGLNDPDVVHTWKSNSLPLRFWVNIIKNPDFVFDVNKTTITDSCLSVIAQTFMDSCSTTEHRLGKDSPSNKLLFAKDIPRYRKLVEKFFEDVKSMPQVSDQEMHAAMQELSRSHPKGIEVNAALKELHAYVLRFNYEILEALDDDTKANKLNLRQRLEQVTSDLDETRV